MKDLGELLRTRREELGMSLEEVAEGAHLSPGIIQAMEKGNFEEIGTALLIRSFLRDTCVVLDLDAQVILQRYQEDILLCDVQQKSLEWYGCWAKNFPRRRRFGLIGGILLVLLLVTIVSGVIWFSRRQQMWLGAANTVMEGYPQQDIPADLSQSRGGGQTPAGRTATEGQERTGSASSEAPAGTPDSGKERKRKTAELEGGLTSQTTAEAAPPATSGFLAGLVGKKKESAEQQPAAAQDGLPQKHHLNIQALDKTWIKIRIDNKKSQSTLLNPGQTLEWEVEGTVQIVVGNAGGVRMVWDGQEIRLSAKAGRVARVRLPDPQYSGG